MNEPQLAGDTHEDGVNFVKAIFQQMGGTALPPRRPGRIPKDIPITVERDAFMTDFENACLSQNWDSRFRAHPKGILRHADAEWGK